MKNGIVRDFDADNGYGWIVPNDGTDDLFVHRGSIVGDDIRNLSIDAQVTYQSRLNSKGIEAINVALSK